MRIAIIVTQDEQGGVQVFLSQFMVWLKSLGHEPMVFSGTEGWLAEQCKNEGVAFKKLKHLKREIHPIHDLLAIQEIKNALQMFKSDAVHLNSTKVGILGSIATRYSLLATRPRIVYRIGGWVFLEDLPAWKKSLYRSLEKATARFKDVIICVHPDDVTVAERAGIKPKLRLDCVPNGIDITQFNASLIPRDVSRDTLHVSGFIFGTIANLYPAKDLPRYIEACALVAAQAPDARFIIIGGGEERSAIEAAIAKHHLENQVHLTGARADADQLLLAFDAFVLPSSKEGMSWGLLRAMAAGLPCISTDVGAAKWMLGDDGLVVPSKNPNALAEAMLRVIREPDLKTRLGAGAHKQVETRFPLEQTFQGNLNALTSADPSRTNSTSRPQEP